MPVPVFIISLPSQVSSEDTKSTQSSSSDKQQPTPIGTPRLLIPENNVVDDINVTDTINTSTLIQTSHLPQPIDKSISFISMM